MKRGILWRCQDVVVGQETFTNQLIEEAATNLSTKRCEGAWTDPDTGIKHPVYQVQDTRHTHHWELM